MNLSGRRALVGFLLVLLTGCTQGPPPAAREFRAVWVATVGNIDWPSRPNLSVEQQQNEIRAIVDRSAELKLNAIILQVRTSCDALYPSQIEPWSEYLTGRQGKAPEPMYDPLQMWIDEAHRRGLELHAWFNPFRSRAPTAKGEDAPTHINRTRPDLAKSYGRFQWLDPGEPEAQERTLRVFMDVVRRYDIDGVHIDDYFYPYPVEGADFPDEPSWKRYRDSGGTLGRADWRRQNINQLIETVYRQIKQEKKWVKFGISPFGIWKPGHPAVVKGFNQYEGLYADAKLWLNEAWCDYFTPQLYWKISAKGQPYGELLDWWQSQNSHGRHLWPGNYTSRIADGKSNWPAGEIVDQIALTRQRGPGSGNVHFSMRALMADRGGIVEALRSGPYAQAALVPSSKWLDHQTPKSPRLDVQVNEGGQAKLAWTERGQEGAWLWAVYVRRGKTWELTVLPGQQREYVLKDEAVEAVAVAAVDRCGNESGRALRRVRAKARVQTARR